MPILVTFLLGIGNFAMHRTVMESGNPLIGRMPWLYHALGGRFSLIVEYLLLLAAMLFAAEGSQAGPISYAVYTALNGISAWLILSGRV
jgi:hypothetical protein